jgi:integrase
MALALYRRHRPKCEASDHHPEGSRTAEFQERLKGYKGRCRCEIHVAGTIGGRRVRQTTGATSWDDARTFAATVEAAYATNGTSSIPTPSAPETPPPSRVTIADACTAFINNRESAEIAGATLRKYRTFTKQLMAFAVSRGYVMIDQWQPGDVDLCYAAWKLGTRTKGKRLGVMRAFFRFCANRKWILETPVSSDLKPPKGSSASADKMPFSDAEITRIMTACDNPPRLMKQRDRHAGQVGCEYKNDQGSGKWTGEDLKDLIELMLHTGFRISDATLFDMSRLQGNSVMIRARKNGNHVFAWVPDFVRDRLIRRAKLHGQRPFIVGRSERLETVTNVWRRRLEHAFDAAGPFEQKPTPHRFRHTFARKLLQRGVPVPDVADLMGDTEQVVRRSYAAWVPERQDRLTKILKDTFSEKPKLTAMQGGRL